MARKYSKLAAAPVPQSQPLDSTQVQNNAGGFVYTIDMWARLNRFLILGSDAQTYYQSAEALTRENAACVVACYGADPARTVNTIVQISDAGRAAKNDAAVFALALGAVSASTVTAGLALAALPKVCRIGTHLFQFIDNYITLGGKWRRPVKKAIAAWYNDKTVESVGYQAIKYRQREGYTHQRLMQTAHPKADTPERIALYQWMRGMDKADMSKLPPQVTAHLTAMHGGCDVNGLLSLIKEHRLPWEALPTECNAMPKVWQTMLPDMGLTALIRNLGNMSRTQAITPLSEYEKIAVQRITDRDAIRKARVHPFTILQAQAVYSQGRGVRGKGEWKVSRPIVDALDDAFYMAFDNIEPTGKRIFLGIDVSGSMDGGIYGSQLVLTPRQIAAAMAMVTVRTEQQWYAMGFSHELVDIDLSARMKLDSVMQKMAAIPMGGTDCALPMIHAKREGMEVDCFIVITDNETWAGHIHPSLALKEYRKSSGINAKLIVMGVTATEFSIADPNDGGMLDVVGMDTSVPTIMADFIKA